VLGVVLLFTLHLACEDLRPWVYRKFCVFSAGFESTNELFNFLLAAARTCTRSSLHPLVRYQPDLERKNLL